MTEKSRIWVQDRNHVIAHSHNVLIQIWKNEKTLEDLPVHAKAAMEHLSLTYPQKVGILVLVEADAKRSTDEARREVADFFRQYKKNITGTSVVVAGNQIKQTLIRAIAVTINLLVREGSPIKVFSELREGIRWLENLTTISFDIDEVHTFTSALRLTKT